METYPLFDSHAHLDDPRFDEDREAVIAQLRTEDVLCTCVGANMQTSEAVLRLAQAHPGLWSAVGVHPHNAKDFLPSDLDQLRQWTQADKVVALGEIGLDYHYDHSPRDVQRRVFAEQLDLGVALGFPTILHVREAHGETLDILRERKDRLPGVIIHCYTGSRESAREYLDLGCTISFSGSVTFKNAKNLQKAARYVPIERMLIETDSPYLAPQPVRGKRNTPLYVRHVCRQIALLKNLPEADVARITRQNALDFYGIGEGPHHA